MMRCMRVFLTALLCATAGIVTGAGASAQRGTAPRGTPASPVQAPARNGLDAAGVALRTRFALQALDRYLETWNSREPKLWATSLHFPHVRPGAGAFNVTQTAEQYAAGINYAQTIATGWHHSEWISREVLQVGVDKVHAAGQWQRYSEDGKALATNIVTYVITQQADGWRVQSRFAAGDGSLDAAAAEKTRAAAMTALNQFFTAWNSHDVKSVSAAIHYPQVRLADNILEVWPTMEAFSAGTEVARQRTWYTMRIDQSRVVQVGPNGVNIIASISKLDRSGKVQARDEGLFLVTLRDGLWKVQARSFMST
jgi:hypothetical protein